MSEEFWPPPHPDPFDDPRRSREDPDHDADLMDQLENEYLSCQEMPATKGIGEALVGVMASIEKFCAKASSEPNLETMSYRLYLKTDHWKKTRSLALELGRNECRVCASKKALNVHHRTYERRGHEDQNDLIVLCRSCHALFHDNGRLATSSEE
jgi:hypothetical protein